MFDSRSKKSYKTTVPKGARYGRKKAQKVERIALKVLHGPGLSHGQMRVLHRLCPCLHGNAVQLVRQEKTTLPLFNWDITKTRLLVDVSFFLLPLASKKVQSCSQPLSPLSLFIFVEGGFLRGWGNVNLQVAVVDYLGNAWRM